MFELSVLCDQWLFISHVSRHHLSIWAAVRHSAVIYVCIFPVEVTVSLTKCCDRLLEQLLEQFSSKSKKQKKVLILKFLIVFLVPPFLSQHKIELYFTLLF